MMLHSDTRRQLLRYAVTGLAANTALYAVYLGLTGSGVGHKFAMTTVYCAGVLGTFVFNRRWTFGHGGAIPRAAVRYSATYLLVYVFNMAVLHGLVDLAGLPHHWVMLALIFSNAGCIFLLQKYWVFPSGREAASG